MDDPDYINGLLSAYGVYASLVDAEDEKCSILKSTPFRPLVLSGTRLRS